MPYSTETLAWLATAHFLIFVVPAIGLGVVMLREEYSRRRYGKKLATIHRISTRQEGEQKTA